MTDERPIPGTLRAIRASLNLTQEQLADRIGVSFATVNRWEGGANKPQKAARLTIAALAEEAGIGMDGGDADGGAAAAARVTRRRTAGKRRREAAATATKSMERMLWDAACSIRGEKDAPKFKDYLLPLLFLKRLSDVFDDEIDRLAEAYGDRGTALELVEADHGLLRCYLPPEARWPVIGGREQFDWPVDGNGRSTRPRDIGEHLTRAMRAVVRQNPSLSGVIDVVDFAAERNGERDINPARLRAVVETFSEPRHRLGLSDVQPDFLGRAYEYLLRKFAEGSGQSAGEFFTPTEVGFLMAHIMRPRPGEECHDYACGSAGLLIKLQLVGRELDPTARVPLKLYGQELTAESYATAHMNAIIHDMDVEVARGDTMINPKFRTGDGRLRTFDIIVANPMWNQPFHTDVFEDDPFDRFRTRGGATTGKGDWAWLQHTLACLNDRGRAAVVLDTGAVTRGSGSKNEDKERNIRKWFVENDLIDGVILLPDNLFYNTSAAGVVVVLSKHKPAARRGRIVLLNATRRVRKGRPKNYIPEDEVRPLAAAFLEGKPAEGEVAVIMAEQAREADYNLSPSRWVESVVVQKHKPISEMIGDLLAIDKETKAMDSKITAALDRIKNTSTIQQHRQMKRLADVADYKAGKTPPRATSDFWEKSEDGVPWVTISDMTEFGTVTDTKEKITSMAFQHIFHDKTVPAGTLIMSFKLTIGRIATLGIDACHNEAIISIHPRKGVDQRFLGYFLSQVDYDQLQDRQIKGNTLNRDKIDRIEVWLPVLNEQAQIADLLDLLRNAIQIQDRKRTMLDDLFKALLHKLMSGEIQASELDLTEVSRT